MATEFFPHEVGYYIQTFEASTRYLTGGHVTGYKVAQQDAGDGRSRQGGATCGLIGQQVEASPPRLMVSLYQEIANFFKDYYQTNI